MDVPYLRAVPGGVELLLAIRPRAGRTRIVGPLGDRLKVQIAAPPVDGEANAELCGWLAERLGVPRASVSITSGDSGRKKTVRVRGIDGDLAARRLAEGV